MFPKEDACRECTRRCPKIHGSRAASTVSYSFFKILVASSFSKFLYLPPGFSSEVLNNKGRLTYLKDVAGKTWRIKISLLNGFLAFQDGWSEFVSDHAISYGELLVFTYIPGLYYVVRIYATSSLERTTFSGTRNGDYDIRKTIAEEPSQVSSPPERDIRAPNNNISGKKVKFSGVDTEIPESKKARVSEHSALKGCKFANAEREHLKHPIKKGRSSGEHIMKNGRVEHHSIKKDIRDAKSVDRHSSLSNKRLNVDSGWVFDDRRPSLREKNSNGSCSARGKQYQVVQFDYSSEDNTLCPTAVAKSSPYADDLKRSCDVDMKKSKKMIRPLNNGKKTQRSKDGKNSDHKVSIKTFRPNTTSHDLERYSHKSEDSSKVLDTRRLSVGKRGRRHKTKLCNTSHVIDTRSQLVKTIEKKSVPKKKKVVHSGINPKVKGEIVVEDLSSEDIALRGQSSSSPSSVKETSDNEFDLRDECKITMPLSVDRSLDKSDGSDDPSSKVAKEPHEVVQNAANAHSAVEEVRPLLVQAIVNSEQNGDKSIPPHNAKNKFSGYKMAEHTCGDDIMIESPTVVERATFCVNYSERKFCTSCNSGKVVKQKEVRNSPVVDNMVGIHILEGSCSPINPNERPPRSRSPLSAKTYMASLEEMDVALNSKQCGEVLNGTEVPKTGSTVKDHDVSKCNSDALSLACIEGNTHGKNMENYFPSVDLRRVFTENNEHGASKGKMHHTNKELYVSRTVNGMDESTSGKDSVNVLMYEENVLASRVIESEVRDCNFSAEKRCYKGIEENLEEHYHENIDEKPELNDHEDFEVNLLDIPVEFVDNRQMNGQVVATEDYVFEEKIHSREMDNLCSHTQRADNTVIALKQKPIEQEISSSDLETYKLDSNRSMAILQLSNATNSDCSSILTENPWLELPQCFPLALQTRWQLSNGKMVILLRDPACRYWPVLYHETGGRKVLNSGWSQFATANDLHPGDVCTFEHIVEDDSEDTFQVHVTSKV